MRFKPTDLTLLPRSPARRRSLTAGLAWIALFCGTLAVLASGPRAEAAEVPWKSPKIEYAAEGKDIKDVLRDFAASQGIPAMVGGSVSGTVSGRFNLPPQRFLDTLAATFGFIWYYDGEVLDIVGPSDMQNALISLDSASVGQLQKTLEQMGVADRRFPLIYDASQGAAIVNGPPSYVKMVKDIAQRVDKKANRRMGDEIQIFPLAHAWATDRTLNVDGQSVTIAGVSTLLNNMYHPQQGGTAAGKPNQSSNMMRNTPNQAMSGASGGSGGSGGSNGPLPPLPPLPSASNGGGAGASPQLQQASAAGGSNDQQPESHKDDVLPVFQPDPRTNSVLVRDLPDRMFQYPELLRRLDVKPRLIEISAQIIEVDDSALDQLGVNWSLHSSHVDLQTGNGTTAQNTYNGTISQTFGNTTLAGGVTSAATPIGMSLSAVLGDAGRYLMTNVQALTQTSQAKIDASPKVTTLNNVEAVMDNSTRFFVPVSGYASADLYTISTGVSLRVLPMVVEENGTTQIKLDVSIEDGQLTSQTVSNLPVITSTNINTSAFISQGQALLIAGYRVDNRSYTGNGVPVLSKIPVIGALFRSTDKSDSHMERLFLLTPRIIEP